MQETTCLYSRLQLQAMFLSLQVFAFKGQNTKLTVKMLFTCILRYDAGPCCDYLELFASTVLSSPHAYFFGDAVALH